MLTRALLGLHGQNIPQRCEALDNLNAFVMPPDLRAKQSSTLADLPIELLTQLAKHAAPGSEAQGHPLLGVARCGRDAVLRSLTRVSLDLNSQGGKGNSSISSIAGLLDRACRAAPTGLNVELALGQHANDLPELLRPAFDSPGGGGRGWQTVHKLRIGPRRNWIRYTKYKVGQEEAAVCDHDLVEEQNW
jgi:hypothetical protein